MRFQAEVTADVRAQDPYTVGDHQASLAEHLLCGIAKQDLGCVIPKANLARLTDSEDPVRGVFEKSKQFRFKHIHVLKEYLGRPFPDRTGKRTSYYPGSRASSDRKSTRL